MVLTLFTPPTVPLQALKEEEKRNLGRVRWLVGNDCWWQFFLDESPLMTSKFMCDIKIQPFLKDTEALALLNNKIVTIQQQ